MTSRYGASGRALTNAERQRRFRDRRGGKQVPMGKAGRPRVAPDDPVELMNRLLRDAKLQNWDGTIAAEVKAQEITKRHELLAMVRAEASGSGPHPIEVCTYCGKAASYRTAAGQPAHVICERRSHRRAPLR